MISNSHQRVLILALLSLACPLLAQKAPLETNVGVVYFSTLYGSAYNVYPGYSGSLLTQGFSSGSSATGSGSAGNPSSSRSDPFSYNCRDLTVVKSMTKLDAVNYMAMSASNLLYLTCKYRQRSNGDVECVQEKCVPAANATHIATHRGEFNTYTLLSTLSNGKTMS